MPKKKGHKKAKQLSISQQIKENQHEDDIVNEEDKDQKKLKTKNLHKSQTDTGLVYPEIVWYLISAFIEPKDIPTFSAINKATYCITKRESFWYSIYRRYCKGHKLLPERLHIDETYRAYGLRQRVIRALYCTYGDFVDRAGQYEEYKIPPHKLLKQKCVSVWYSKGQLYWNIYIKFKKSVIRPLTTFEDEGRVCANPEEDNIVLQICSKHVYNIPPLMGMTLSSFCLSYMSPGLKLQLGFRSPPEAISNFQALRHVVLDTVCKWNIYEWWHPKYPHFEVKPPPLMKDEESLPILDVDFFDLTDED
ncbi:transmembrane protein 183 isoform X1 [Pieris brassicae]|uniref:F-box domain-containing protein n=1 Tax=Pieris brassicae TaxID=7116 RepID=A0A9P0TT26_PIEBR|nr:transmembrane protein 183 isoform X1 [Pieris brassicae]CAH4037900.1 unnamed protein product [Pieris brassicae]